MEVKGLSAMPHYNQNTLHTPGCEQQLASTLTIHHAFMSQATFMVIPDHGPTITLHSALIRVAVDQRAHPPHLT